MSADAAVSAGDGAESASRSASRSVSGAVPGGGAAPGPAARESFRRMWRELLPIGRDPETGGYRRYAWSAADRDCRAWFRTQAQARGLRYERDRNGNQWAWLDPPAHPSAGPATHPSADPPRDRSAAAAGAGDPDRRRAVVTGSHLDSVPDGGAFDGPLGVVSAFAALDELRDRGVLPPREPGADGGAGPGPRPLAVVNFADEEGARFGPACVGSRLATGALTPEAARALRDSGGTTLARALERADLDPEAMGPDPERLAGIGAFVELHVEQGRALVDTGHPVGLASAIWPHGRWRFDFAGEGNHAGTTALADRRDPMLTYATTVLAARKRARLAGALATFGKVSVDPGGVNAIASRVRGWLDSRAPDEPTLAAVVAEIERAATERGDRDGVRVTVARESYSPLVEFPDALRERMSALLGGGVPVLPTGAGHDAGVLSAAVPTAMLFVRNPTGVSHAPAERAEEEDCLAGVRALADVLEGLACR